MRYPFIKTSHRFGKVSVRTVFRRGAGAEKRTQSVVVQLTPEEAELLGKRLVELSDSARPRFTDPAPVAEK